MELLFSFVAASLALTFAPGPDILLVISESVSKGSRSGLLLSAGLVCGLPFHTLILVLGWGQFITFYPNLISIIKVIGALYFIYIAFQIFRNLNQELKFQKIGKKKGLNIFMKGLLMNLLNPKVTLFFWFFFPAFLFDNMLTDAEQYLILGTLFILQAALVFTFVSLTASKLSEFFLKNSKIRYCLNFLQGILLVGIAIYLLL